MSFRLTIITISFNCKRALSQTLDSVFLQLKDDIEIIVIDGGSDDGTVEMIESEYNGLISIFVSEPDGGIYPAMNKGVLLANGDFLLFLNAGDTLLSDTLDQIREAPALLNCLVKNSDQKLWWRKPNLSKFGMPTAHQAIVYVNEKLYYNEYYTLSADYEYTLRNNINGYERVYQSGGVVYDNTGQSKKRYRERDLESLEIIHKYYGAMFAILFLVKIYIKNFLKLVKTWLHHFI